MKNWFAKYFKFQDLVLLLVTQNFFSIYLLNLLQLFLSLNKMFGKQNTVKLSRFVIWENERKASIASVVKLRHFHNKRHYKPLDSNLRRILLMLKGLATFVIDLISKSHRQDRLFNSQSVTKWKWESKWRFKPRHGNFLIILMRHSFFLVHKMNEHKRLKPLSKGDKLWIILSYERGEF